MKLFVLLVLIACGYSTIGQEVAAVLTPRAQSTETPVAPTGPAAPEGFPTRLPITDEEFRQLFVTNSNNSVGVRIYFDDGTEVATGLFERYAVNGYNDTRVRSVRDTYLAKLRSEGHNQAVVKSQIFFNDRLGNTIIVTDENDQLSEEQGHQIIFRTPYATNITVRGVYEGAVLLMRTGTANACVAILREAMGTFTGPSSSVSIFTSDNRSVTYGLENGLVYPTTISIKLVFNDEQGQLTPVIEVSGPPGEWFEIDQSVTLTEWTLAMPRRQMGTGPIPFDVNTGGPIGFFKPRVVAPPEP